MPIAAGTRLGTYEVLSALGAGGMGEVYRARDAKLGREVALKVLPSEVAADRDRLRRFEQEARAASSLNHPNIVTIHDIGTSDSTAYIAMELVEGRTLRDLLSAGPLAVRRILDIGAQVADGLAKAHGAGIAHRDLKPENVMVTKDGFVKILDFGLAKLSGTASGDFTHSPTVVQETKPGTVLGTVGYMSPEQASGQPVDFRSDQFALGSILYEMSTGVRAFVKPTAAQTMAAIIQDEPEPIGKLNSKAPAPLRWIVERCLAKEPDHRYASTRDLARELVTLRDHLSESTSADLVETVPVRVKTRGALLVAAAALAAAALVAGFFAGGARKRTPLPTFQRLTYRRGTIRGARFAPDRQTIVYAAAWDGQPSKLFTTRPGGAESRPLDLPDGDLLAMSRAGEMAILMNTSRAGPPGNALGTLARVPLAGGAPRPVLEEVQDADFSPDGRELAVIHRTGTKARRIEYPIGKVLYEGPNITSVRVSPKGDLVAFLQATAEGREVNVVDRQGKKRTVIPKTFAFSLAWSPGGDEIWFEADGIAAVSLSGRRRGLYRLFEPSSVRICDISPDGRTLISVSEMRAELTASKAGGAPRNLSLLGASRALDISRDGETVLFTDGPDDAAYVRKTDGSGPALRVADDMAISLSPDARWVLSIRGSPAELLLTPTGPGSPRTIKTDLSRVLGSDFFADGKRLLLAASRGDAPMRSYVIDLATGASRAVTPEGVLQSAISPDGRWIAAFDEQKRIALYPVEGGEQPRLAPGPPEEKSLGFDLLLNGWTSDERAVYLVEDLGTSNRIFRRDLATGKREVFAEVGPTDPAGVFSVHALVTPDGNTRICTTLRALGTLQLVEGLR
jgi:dipeptidyl aminopeptidase/acylaminoacyl peptidase